jgi:phage tail-like protein
MADNPRRDPYLSFCFKVTINAAGISEATGFFKSVGGLSIETEVIDYREGGLNDTTHKIIGATKYKNIVLKRGFSGMELISWREQWLNGPPKKRAFGTIQQLSPKPGSAPIATWTFTEAFPVKWELSELDASKSEVLIETLEIAHEGLTRS